MLLQVAWFVSNCHPRNQRMHYAKELSKYIQVDIYGTCGSLRCPRSQSQACFDMLDEDYKFYLAFENSNCKDYITEKFFVNGLGYDTFFTIYACTRDRSYANYKRMNFNIRRVIFYEIHTYAKVYARFRVPLKKFRWVVAIIARVCFTLGCYLTYPPLFSALWCM